MTDRLKLNANLVEALGSALREGDHSLGTVPGLVKRVLIEESWREFVTQRGDHVRHERFADFVVAQPLRGIGASVDLVRRIVADDVEAVDLLDRALQQRHGGDRSKGDVITLADPNRRGTSKDYALRKLRKDAPELHAQVIAGRLSAHAAMVRAGFRPKTFTVRAESAEDVVATLRRRLPLEMLTKVVEILAS
ncbi:hypothetical protein ABT369_39115 [Dactylosporangium sp. NPDC000244]|uniref:hypothetical protein n=1 Tax=Dactylosporangium sp. NPDC000244 TaxID=3154365 RepID=UPI00332B557D